MPEPATPDRETPPSALLFLLEGPRAFLEASALLPAGPLLASAPRGDGHPVLVIPGFMADDDSTFVLRRYLRRLGYYAESWRLGRNVGDRGNRVELGRRLAARVAEIHTRRGRKLSLVGWSLGGIYAREIARHLPDRIRHVVTLGSPFGDRGNASNVRRFFERMNGYRARWDDAEAMARRRPPSVPSTAIFTRTDGVVAWSACLEDESPTTENIEVRGSHCGLGFNPAVLYAVADRLAQPEGGWRPFDRSGWRRLVYG